MLHVALFAGICCIIVLNACATVCMFFPYHSMFWAYHGYVFPYHVHIFPVSWHVLAVLGLSFPVSCPYFSSIMATFSPYYVHVFTLPCLCFSRIMAMFFPYHVHIFSRIMSIFFQYYGYIYPVSCPCFPLPWPKGRRIFTFSLFRYDLSPHLACSALIYHHI